MAPVGRERELELVASLLGERRDGLVVLLEGEAGIGKTTVWRAALEEARELGYRVLACAAGQAETTLSLTALRDLLDDAFDEVADALPAPQRRALEVTLLREEPRGPPAERETVAVGFLTSLRLLASRAPMLVAVDDVQWLDAASAAPLAYAVRRLGSAPVTFLLARRAGTPLPALDVARIEPGRLERLELAGLSVGALGRILHDRIGVSFSRPTLQRIHSVAGGNPFYAVELARALAEVGGVLRPGAPLPVPESLRTLVEERLGALPPATFEALAFAAALSRPTVGALTRAIGDEAGPRLSPALEARVIELRDDEIRFAHPLFAAGVYELAADRRPVLHSRLAEIVDDVEQRARHLALAAVGPEALVAGALDEGAAAAFARGDPAAAAELVACARELTPAGGRTDALARAATEAEYRFEAGDTARAVSLLDGLLGDAPPGEERARILARKARIQHFGDDIGRSVALLVEALAEAGEDGALRGEIEEGLAWGMLLLRHDLPAAAAHARSAVEQAERLGGSAALAEALAAAALTAFVLGQDGWETTMARAVSLEEPLLGARVVRHPSFALGYCLSCSDDLARARDVFDELLRRSDQLGDESSVPSLLNHLALVEWLAGEWDAAAALADDGFERALESGQLPTQASILAKRALVDACRGDLAAAHERAARALELVGADPARPESAPSRGGETAIWVLGLCELTNGDPEAADRRLGPLCQTLLAAGVQEPGELRCLLDEIEALVALGAAVEASALVTRLEAWAERVARPSVSAAAARGRARLLAHEGDADSALELLAAAADHGARSQLRFERARGLLELGVHQRRARRRRDARASLEAAVSLFDALGSDLWSRRARAELARIGGRTPRADGLTPTEERVAGLVAEGKSNKEAAAALVVSVHTVEASLTSIYRKLDVRSRTEMAQKLREAATADDLRR